MEAVEKREYIHSHLHQLDEECINEIYQKMHSIIEENDSIVGYEASGEPIKKSQFIADIREAETQIEKGQFTTIEDVEKESEKW
ncbi:hypothetical protein DMA11_23295 [Marinilabiliaceae bacterium JC017]|nr:hypothetical protein DMA11_23295 [Marinilabiliaceae bacterium JC017]